MRKLPLPKALLLLSILFTSILIAFSCKNNSIEAPFDETKLSPTQTPAKTDNSDKYMITLTASKKMEKDIENSIHVWVGSQRKGDKPLSSNGNVSDSTLISENLDSLYAKIIPHAPNFTINPPESEYIKIIASGTSVPFTVVPSEKGKQQISAHIKFYEDKEGERELFVKTSNLLTVRVIVKATWRKKLNELFEDFWDQFKIFWAALIALILGAILFIIRKLIKKKTGYEEKSKDITADTKTDTSLDWLDSIWDKADKTDKTDK